MPEIDEEEAGATLYFAFNTQDPADGSPITLAGTPAVKVYKDADDTEDDSGITLAVDDDGRTGFHRVTIDTSSDGTFYAAGHKFFVVITSGTVAGISVVGKKVAEFKLTAAGGGGLTAADVWDYLTSAITTSGSIGKLIKDNLDATVSSRSTVTTAQVNAEVDTALADIRLDELLVNDSDIDGAAPPTIGSVFHELMSKSTGTFTFDQTTDSLEAIRDRGDAAWLTGSGTSTLTAADVWNYATRILTAGTNIVLAKDVGVTGFNDISAEQVNAEVLDVWQTDTHAELTNVPGATSSHKDRLGWLFWLARNKITETATTQTLHNDAGVAKATATVSDDGSTFTRNKWVDA